MRLATTTLLAPAVITAVIVGGALTAPASAEHERLPDGRHIKPYTVRPGDTATELAVRFHAWTDELIAHNHLGRRRRADGRGADRDPGRHRCRRPGPRPPPYREAPRSPSYRGPLGEQGCLPLPASGAPGHRPGVPARGRRPPALARGVLAGGRVADAPRLQRRRHRGHAGAAVHGGVDGALRRPRPQAATAARQRGGRGDAARRAGRGDGLPRPPGRRLLPGPRRRTPARPLRRHPGPTSTTCWRSSTGWRPDDHPPEVAPEWPAPRRSPGRAGCAVRRPYDWAVGYFPNRCAGGSS